MAIFCVIGCSIAVIYWQRAWFSHFLYDGDGADGVYLIKLLLFVLPAVILLNTINELFSGMRMFRAVTMLQFAQSLLFAALALSLTASWHAGADSVITGYGAHLLAVQRVSAVLVDPHVAQLARRARPRRPTPRSGDECFRSSAPFG